MRRQLRPTLVLPVAFTLLTGFLYPAVVTVVAGLAFPAKATGSLVVRDGRAVGSALIGQQFSGSAYFWTRPSATGPVPYNGASSAGSNLGPSSPALTDSVRQRVAALRAADPGSTAPVPVDLVTASGSGLDPDISPASAAYQLDRVARARGLPSKVVTAVVARHTAGRTFGLLGEPRVNVLLLNLALDSTFGPRKH